VSQQSTFPVFCFEGQKVPYPASSFLPDVRGVQDPDLRTRIRQDSPHFEQTGLDPDYGFIQVFGSGSGFSISFFDI